MSLKLSNEDFIIKASKIHNNKYDYSLVNYEGTLVPVKIICSTHGVFEKTPDNHLHNKRGCPMCSNKKITNDMFISRCKEIHGEKYDYSLIDYELLLH